MPKLVIRDRYPIFDWFRLLLALSVVYLHSWNATGPKLPFLVWPAVPGFLMISGFLVLQSRERSRSWSHWAWKRLLRLIPAFIFALVLLALMKGAAAIPDTLRQYVTLGLDPRHQGSNPVLWSLGWEELFYALMCVAYAAGWYRKSVFAWSGLVVSTAICAWLWGSVSIYAVRALPLGMAFFTGNLFYLYRDRLTWNWASPKWLPELPFDASYGSYIYGLLVQSVVMSYTRDRASVVVASMAGSLLIGVISWYAIEKPFLKLKDWRLYRLALSA